LRIVTIGGGPAGLYVSLLMKRADPTHEVTVLERNRADDTFGWGVVFSDQTLENLRLADEPTHRAITENFAHWDDIDIHFRGRTITSSGHGFSGIARRRLLAILQTRAAELGVDLRFQQEVSGPEDLLRHGLGGADLVVAADGANSVTRRALASHFQPDVDARTARYIWLGTTLALDAFTFVFVENEHGVYQVHGYRFDAAHSTFIVECDEASWRAAGLDRMDVARSVAYCERLFARWLHGHPLISNASPDAEPWTRFLRVRNARWFHDNIVLIGDAAHTAHFSIGSGTKLAMEDAIVLARELSSAKPLEQALGAYQDERMTEALRLQNAARNSMEWFESVKRYVHLEPEQFAYSLLTRSQRVSHENLRLRDRQYLEGVERWWQSRAQETATHDTGTDAARPRAEALTEAAMQPPRAKQTHSSPPPTAATPNDAAPPTAAPNGRGQPIVAPSSPEKPVPPMFTPYRLRGVTLHNRIVVAPMDMYSAVEGTPNDFHLVHLGARALGGAGLVFTEMVCVSPEARITLGCTGLYTDEHTAAWARVVSFVHAHSSAKMCLQLGHSGRKGSTKLMWEGMDEPLETGNWEVMGPSPLPWSAGHQTPRPMTLRDMECVRDQFVRSTERAIDAGFDMLELHCAHGYLLSSFLTPVSNRRTDAYGGALENRMRYPLEVFGAMRVVWPAERPMSVRISASDWVEDGIGPAEAVAIGQAFMDAGADIIHVSAGQTTPAAQPVYGRMFQTPFSDRIRNEARIPTIAVGNITDADQVNSIIMAGRADLCALARPHLSDPQWTLRAAAQQGYAAQPWPPQYFAGKRQMERAYARLAEQERARDQ
jgi:anthraniloyl-CoA monooxygenase